MLNKIRYELSFKDISQLENKLKFCISNKLNKINIPCKGLIKKEFFDQTFEYIKKNFQGYNVVYHYSLYHQYTKSSEISYEKFLDFVKKCKSNENFEMI